jgi:YegS/Rv2252/BmrU family lipid kinase
MKKNLFIINPKSGTGYKKNIRRIISQNFSKSEYDIEYTKAKGHATDLSKKAAILKYDSVIGIGGDGTINEIANGLIGSESSLGIVPCGSGNGFSRHLKIPQDFEKVIRDIPKYRRLLIDTLKINDEFFLGIAGIGFDAHIAYLFANVKKRGFLTYAKLVISEFFKYRPKKYKLIIDGKEVFKEAFLLSFAKSSQYGNNIIIAPNAKLDDGYFQVAILKYPPIRAIFEIFLRLKNGSIHKSKYYETYKCKEVFIKESSIIAHMDGEPFLFKNETNIKIFPKSLKVLVP